MKILIIGPVPPPIDGCANANKVLFENIKSRGISCELVNTNTNSITNEQGRKFSLKKAINFLHNYRYILKIAKSDIVYFTLGQTFYGVLKYAPFILTCILLKVPYIIHVHGNFLGDQYKVLSGLKKAIFHRLISNAVAGIVITKSLTKIFDGLLPDEKVFTVDYFVEDDLYTNGIEKKIDKLRILYLSNLMKEKGILELLDALQELKLKGLDFQVTIAGAIEAGLEDQVNTRFEKLGSNLEYIGIVSGSDKIRAFREANVFVLPTYYTMEGLPFSILEAIATGNIVVSTAHAGIPDVIDSSNGFLIDKGSSKAIAACLEGINTNLIKSVEKISSYNVSYARTKFTEKNYTDKIIKIVEASLSRA